MDFRKDYYAILEIDRDGSKEEIRAAYRRLAKLHHPDKNPDSPDDSRFKEINEAYEILGDEIDKKTYDEYFKHKTRPAPPQARGPLKKTYTRKSFVSRTQKIHIYGRLSVKFWGEPETMEENFFWERSYKIHPTEVLLDIDPSELYNKTAPGEYSNTISVTDLFKTPLPKPLSCRIRKTDGYEYYALDIDDIRISNPEIKHVMKTDHETLGTLEGYLYGYTTYQEQEEIEEEVTEFYGDTGKKESRTEAGVVYERQQYYYHDGSTYWTDWQNPARPRPTSATGNKAPYFRPQPQSQPQPAPPLKPAPILPFAPWLIIWMTLAAIWPYVFIVSLIFLAVYLFLLLTVRTRIPGHIWFIICGCLALVSIAYTAFHAGASSPSTASSLPIRAAKPADIKTILRDTGAAALITHSISWTDYDSNHYTTTLSISHSSVRQDDAFTQTLDKKPYFESGIGAYYHDLSIRDEPALDKVVTALDSLKKIARLDDMGFLKATLSMIQSIPYSEVLDGPCPDTASVSCIGNTTFGVRTPVQFLSDLKGDCDTRALFLYSVLKRFNYNVSVLTSDYYHHAIIAVNLPGESTPLLCETTSSGWQPGNIPPSIDKLQYWKIALLNKTP